MPRHEAEQFDFPFLRDFYPGDEVWVSRGRVVSIETKDVCGEEIEPKLIVENEQTGLL